jgi:hypothetical protein
LWPLVAAAAFGCATGPKACHVPSDCNASSECLANQCVAIGSSVVAPDSARLVLFPNARGVSTEPDEPADFFLDFDLSSVRLQLQAAFLLVPTDPRADTGTLIVAARQSTTWGAAGQSNLGPHPTPSAQGDELTTLCTPGMAARIDVTRLAESWLNESNAAHGVRLQARTPDGVRVSLSPSALEQTRLELYGKPTSRKSVAP